MDSPIEVVERVYAALDEEDVAPFLDLCARDVTVEYPAAGRLPYGGTWHGRDEVAAFLEAHDGAEEIVAFERREMLEAGELVVVLGEFEGRAKPTGRLWSTRFVHLMTIRAGVLQEWRSFFDTAAALDAHASDT